jgi:hypothetical protein
MTYFLCYLLLCKVTAIIGCIKLYAPTIKKLESQSINHLLITRRYTGYFSILICFAIGAPLLAPVLLNDRAIEIFKSELLKSFLS